MTAPMRIQRKRTKGWRMPPNTVYVGRPTKWGNPFVPGREYNTIAAGTFIVRDAAHAVRLYVPLANILKPKIVKRLRGKNLACWCPLDRPCHADVLLEMANR